MMPMPSYAEKVKQLSDQLVQIQRPIQILDAIKWPKTIESRFFEQGAKVLPEIDDDYYQQQPLSFSVSDKQQQLIHWISSVKRSLGLHDPLGKILRETAEQYLIVLDLLKNRGQPKFLTYSRQLYGSARDHLYGDQKTLFELAERLCRIFSLPSAQRLSQTHERNIDASTAVELLKHRLTHYFTQGEVNVILSDGIVSDASAGGDSIKLNSHSYFSHRDLQVLEVHEGWVHVGTTLNGRKQPYATWLSVGSPRITAVQEGLAVLIETLTFSSFPGRARRISDRVMAIDMAERGADFLEVYRHFVERGLSEGDSYKIAQRVFRGGQVAGGSCFTKDLSYAKGLVETVNFIRSAITAGVPEILPMLFVGKVALEDLPILYEYSLEGLIQMPTYLPALFRDLNGLYTWFGFSSGINLIDLDKIQNYFQKLFEHLPISHFSRSKPEDTELE